MLIGGLDGRSFLAGIGGVCCLGACLLAPLAASQGLSSNGDDRLLSELQHLPAIAPISTKSRHPILARDPFREPADIRQRISRLRSSREADTAIRVEGIIDGARPRALVRVGHVERIVAVGESIEGIRIVEIDDAGIRLTSGLRLRLETGEAP